MNSTILLVDDEPGVLRGYQRIVGDMFACETASSAAEALQKITAENNYALIMTDYRMPGMSGVELLKKAHELCPNTTRMLITGFADVKVSMEAINAGSVFRMLTKPCDPQSFYRAIEDGLRQHELLTAEGELLDKTLKGSVQVLVDILSVLDPKAFGRAQKLSVAARAVGQLMKVEKLWELEMAATLGEVGRATLPGSLAYKHLNSVDLTQAEERLLMKMPETSWRLLAHIPRLDSVANIVLYQGKNMDGSGFPEDGLRGDYIPLSARILRVLNEVQLQVESEREVAEVLENLKPLSNKFDPAVIAACHNLIPVLTKLFAKPQKSRIPVEVSLGELKEGQYLVSNIETTSGVLIMKAGTVISPVLLQRVYNFATIMPIKQPIQVIAE